MGREDPDRLTCDVTNGQPENITVPDRCECLCCFGHHQYRCPRTRGELYQRRHPVALHRFEGQILCHLCLGRRLELRLQRLYPDVIPLIEGNPT